MRIALAQINTTVGDFPGNLQKIRQALEQAHAAGVELVVLPEQSVPGYPAEDLLEREDFIADAEKTFEQVVRSTEGLKAGVVVGTLIRNGLKTGKPVFNSAAFILDGQVLGVQHKTLLPTYDVFDEGRYFQPAGEHRVFDFAGRRLGLAICEDVWNDPEFWSHRLYTVDPVEELIKRGAEILIAISASPFSMGRSKFRLHMLQALARRWDVPLVYVNLVGGNTTLVFDGNSLALGKRGELLLQSPAFKESFDVLDLRAAAARVEEPRDEVDEAFQALAWFDVGAQNFVLADGAGNIGYDPHAWVPLRPAGCLPWAPMRGDGSCDWTGRVADTDLPQARNPAAGWVATANNDITGSTADNDPLTSPPPYPPDQYLYYTNDLGYRHARIAQRLTERPGGYTLDDMTAIQADVHSLFAEALVPALLAWWSSSNCVFTDVDGSGDCSLALADRGLTAAAALLADWAAAGPRQFQTPTGLATSNPAGPASADGSERQAAAASMLFHALVPRLARLILDDDLVRHGYSVSSWLDSQLVAKYLVALGGYARNSPPAVPLLTETLFPSLCPGPLTDTCADAAVLALQEAVAFLSAQPEFGPSALPQDWLWGRLHRAFFRSNLSPTTTLLDYGPFANDGGLHTVDVANFSWSNDGPGGFTQGSGANVRFAAEVGSSSIRWRAVIPGGQSGFAGDPNYMDQIPAYLANQPRDQPYARSEVEAAASRSLRFTP